jgi:quercetin dioxygenase-like cupin family protein
MSSLISHIPALAMLPFPIPGATPGGVFAQLVNIDGAKGLVTTVIHIAPGAMIPAHLHKNGSEAHYVLEGDFIEDGVSYGPGTYLTHPANTRHGPHSSVGGCKVLTMQTSFVDPQNPDFNIAE